jgi:hypothetical protein
VLCNLSEYRYLLSQNGNHHACKDVKDRIHTHLQDLSSWKMSAGAHNLLRVVATFPSQPGLEIAEDADKHPLASLNMDLVGGALPQLYELLRGWLTKQQAEPSNVEDEPTIPPRSGRGAGKQRGTGKGQQGNAQGNAQGRRKRKRT